ncbi:MAG: hypothetical protein QM731_25700 [Chitinophagaceae bacterium]
MLRYFAPIILIFVSCSSSLRIRVPIAPVNAVSGTAFYKKIIPLTREERERIAVQEILSGNVPSFLKRFVPISTSITDSTGKIIEAVYFVSPDYLSVGNDDDFARIPLTPMAAQQVADAWQCFLPTRKIVNDIYRQATVKPEPVPMFSYRDSAITFWQHHLIIEGQRKNRKGLIAGIKKDVVISGKSSRDAKADRVAIYGWHMPDGKPIQPLYTGHVNWYVDYSHGIRLIWHNIKVNGEWMDYKAVLQDPLLHTLICDEEFCDCYRY